MQTRTMRLGWGALAAAAVALAAGNGLAQAHAGATKGAGRGVEAGGKTGGKEDAEPVRVRRLDPRGSSVETPEFRSSASAGTALPKKWTRFVVDYDTSKEWIDELTFQYYLMTLGEVEGKKAYGFFTAKVTYVNVERGRHVSDVYLRPATVKRWVNSPVAMAVEVYIGDRLVATESETSIKMPSKQWWKDPAVVERPEVIRRDGQLYDRSKTPFALIDIDNYDVVK